MKWDRRKTMGEGPDGWKEGRMDGWMEGRMDGRELDEGEIRIDEKRNEK